MKIFLSADIEGCAGVVHWDETFATKPDYRLFQDQMNAEVAAACEGAITAGAADLLVKDAHETARNLIHTKLPTATRLHRGWSGHPFGMMDGIDETFDAAFMIGYHARAGSPGNPLAHTWSSSRFALMRLNDEPASEFLLNALIAAYRGVPVALVTGDETLCAEVRAFDSAIVTVPTKSGQGAAATCRHPSTVLADIRSAAESCLRGGLKVRPRPMSKLFKLELEYRDISLAYRKSFYPGARLVDDRTLRVETHDFFDVMRFISFSG